MIGSLTKIVLLMGAVAFGGLLILPWLAPWSMFWNPSASPFAGLTGTAPLAGLWMGLLLFALVADYWVSRRDRRAVRPFAKVLNPESLDDDDSVTQDEDEGLLTTSTSGAVGDRVAAVTLRELGRTGPSLRVDVACQCPWVLDIRRRSVVARLLGRLGAAVSIGDPELDRAVIVQADDEVAVRQWLREPEVRRRVLSLFRERQLESISLAEGGSVLRAEFRKNNPLRWPPQDATAITAALSALAERLAQR